MTLTFHPATESDLNWLETLRRAVYYDLFMATWGAWDEARHGRHWAAFLEVGQVFLILENDTPLGMVQYTEDEAAIEIHEIQIQPEYQGQGYGTQVIQRLLKEAQSKHKKVTLSTGLKNAGAIKLYQKLGFNIVKEAPHKVYMEYAASTV